MDFEPVQNDLPLLFADFQAIPLMIETVTALKWLIIVQSPYNNVLAQIVVRVLIIPKIPHFCGIVVIASR